MTSLAIEERTAALDRIDMGVFDSYDLALLVRPRLLLHTPVEQLNRAPEYEQWGDLDQLVRATDMVIPAEDAPPSDPTAVVSLGRDLLHRPTLDLDGNAVVTAEGLLRTARDSDVVIEEWHEWPQLGPMHLIPSRHNQHGYGDQTFTWTEYARILIEMRRAGALGKGWVNLSKHRGFTLLRHPWNLKPADGDHEEPW